MAEEKNRSIFRVESDDTVRSTDKLNEYIRIGSPGGFIMIASLLIITAALIVWGFVGTIPVTITEYGGVARKYDYTNTCICFVDVHLNTGLIPVGNKATLHMPDGTSYDGHISYMSAFPQSSDELRDLHGPTGESEAGHFSEWVLNYLLEDSAYNYVAYIETEEDISSYWHQVVEVTIITGEVKPISLLMR